MLWFIPISNLRVSRRLISILIILCVTALISFQLLYNPERRSALSHFLSPVAGPQAKPQPTPAQNDPIQVPQNPPIDVSKAPIDVQVYLDAILKPEEQNLNVSRLHCPNDVGNRYDYLRSNATAAGLPTYLFALDLYQCAHVLPSLMSAVVESMKILGPENCAVSVVEGRSHDGTKEILYALNEELGVRNFKSFFQTSELDPSQGQRIDSLAALRNLALKPYTDHPEQYSESSTIIFLNDISLCAEDILELIHQRQVQQADMTCAMDWTFVGPDPTFYDVWIARGMTGDSFFNIPVDGNWNSAWNIFWNDPLAKENYNRKTPFQVFSCWNGVTAFTATPLLEKKVTFRSAHKLECWQGEPKLFCKDMWHTGYGKIAVVPSVNVEYSDEGTKRIKDLKGFTNKWTTDDNDRRRIEWRKEPPSLVKCMPSYEKQEFIPWDEGL